MGLRLPYVRAARSGDGEVSIARDMGVSRRTVFPVRSMRSEAEVGGHLDRAQYTLSAGLEGAREILVGQQVCREEQARHEAACRLRAEHPGQMLGHDSVLSAAHRPQRIAEEPWGYPTAVRAGKVPGIVSLEVLPAGVVASRKMLPWT